MADSFHWFPEKRGIYSTKSGYALAKLHAAEPAHTMFSSKHNVWNCSAHLKLTTSFGKLVVEHFWLDLLYHAEV